MISPTHGLKGVSISILHFIGRNYADLLDVQAARVVLNIRSAGQTGAVSYASGGGAAEHAGSGLTWKKARKPNPTTSFVDPSNSELGVTHVDLSTCDPLSLSEKGDPTAFELAEVSPAHHGSNSRDFGELRVTKDVHTSVDVA